MKISKSQLKQIIKEELSSALLELEDYERRDLETGLATAAGETPQALAAQEEKREKDDLIGRILDISPDMKGSMAHLQKLSIEKLQGLWHNLKTALQGELSRQK